MNIFNYITPEVNETCTSLLTHKNIKINRIVSSEHLDPIEYVQEEDEWLILLKGKATLLVDNKEKLLHKGDTLFIPRKTPHTVLKTSHGTVWLTIHIS